MSLIAGRGCRWPPRRDSVSPCAPLSGGRDTHDGHENSPILVFFSNLLVAELFELCSFAPEVSGHGFSSAASATVAALCRQHGEDLGRLVSSLPAATANAAALPTRGSRP